jgi:predicted  nucleic acid-binding Zn-ribbon protein
MSDDDLEALLAVQELDTAADVLRHRRANLPERQELEARNSALATVEQELAPIREQRKELARAQQAIEDEIALLAEKRAAVDKAMYSNTNPKELQAMQEELDSFDRRRSTLEDRVLEHMVEAEPLDEAIAAGEARRGEVDDDAVALLARLAEAETGIDAELAALEDRRAPLAAAVGDALLARYEKLRTRLKGVGVAKLTGNKCEGCHLTLPAAEAEAVRRQAREERIAECPECDRLLVV